MSSDLKYLCRLIEMVDKDQNEHSRKRLWSLIANLAKNQIGTITEKEATVLINEVHELNMEQYIRVQAKHFYDEFPFPEHKNQLIKDFIEMEHCRRRDDFEGFSLAVFQQVENITNHIYKNYSLFDRAKSESHIQMFTGKQQRYGGTLGEQLVHFKVKDKKTVIDRLFNTEPDRVEFLPKFKMTLYYGYFNEVVKTFDEWNNVFYLGYDLYLSRNKNHRGSIETDSQKNKQRDLDENKYRYYLLFLGFLADFIQKISAKYSKSREESVEIQNLAKEL